MACSNWMSAVRPRSGEEVSMEACLMGPKVEKSSRMRLAEGKNSGSWSVSWASGEQDGPII